MESNKRKSPPFYSQSSIPRSPLTVVSNIHQHSNPHSHHPRMNAPRLEISQDTMRLQWQSSGKMAVAPSCHVGTRCRTSHRASSVWDGRCGWNADVVPRIGMGLWSLYLLLLCVLVCGGGWRCCGGRELRLPCYGADGQNVGWSCRRRYECVGTWGQRGKDIELVTGGRFEPRESEGVRRLCFFSRTRNSLVQVSSDIKASLGRGIACLPFPRNCSSGASPKCNVNKTRCATYPRRRPLRDGFMVSTLEDEAGCYRALRWHVAWIRVPGSPPRSTPSSMYNRPYRPQFSSRCSLKVCIPSCHFHPTTFPLGRQDAAPNPRLGLPGPGRPCPRRPAHPDYQLWRKPVRRQNVPLRPRQTRRQPSNRRRHPLRKSLPPPPTPLPPL